MVPQAYECNYAGIAAALRMGLHLPGSSFGGSFMDRQLTQRRQVFAVLNFMDVFISSVLGIRHTLEGVDRDQLIAVPEEETFDDGRSFVERNPYSPTSETILIGKLYRIQVKILTSRYSAAESPTGLTRSYEPGYEDIAGWEAELREWHQSLPEMSPENVDARVLRSQLGLRLGFATVQTVMYQPFLHHFIEGQTDRHFDTKVNHSYRRKMSHRKAY